MNADDVPHSDPQVEQVAEVLFNEHFWRTTCPECGNKFDEMWFEPPNNRRFNKTRYRKVAERIVRVLEEARTH